MILAWMCPPAFKAHPYEFQRESCRVRWNPGYWVCWFGGFGCILPGLWFHTLFGQDGQLREDETLVEREVRVHWVYGCDGPMVLELIYEVYSVFVNLGHADWDEAFSCTIAIVVAGCYMMGNVIFMRAMKLQHYVEIRMCIMAGAAFGIGLAIALVGSLVRGPRGLPGEEYLIYNATTKHWENPSHNNVTSIFVVDVGGDEVNLEEHVPGVSWILKGAVVFFMFLSVFCYRRLWNLHKPPVEQHHDDGCCMACYRWIRSSISKACRALAVLSAMSVTWLLLFIAFTVGGDDVWNALG